MMNRTPAFVVCFVIGQLLAALGQAQVFTVEIPQPPTPISITNFLVNHGDSWHWRRGTNEPGAGWNMTADSSLDLTWNMAPGGFGFGDDAILGEATRVNPGMSNIHTTLYIRRSLVVSPDVDTNANLILKVDYDDGFVAYLDGEEIVRHNISGTSGSVVTCTATTGGISHEASCCNSPNAPTIVELGTIGARLIPGEHVFAVIGVNQSINSSDFHVIADLYTLETFQTTNVPPLVNRGFYAWTTNSVVLLNGFNTIPEGVLVTVNGDQAELRAGEGAWSKSVELRPGWNNMYLAVHDLYGGILTNIEQPIVYETDARHIGGALTGTVAWNDPGAVTYLTNSIVVHANARLEIGPGAVIILPPGNSITAIAAGTIAVQGTSENHALFLPANGTAWGWLMAGGANANLNLRYAEVVAGQVRITNGAAALIEDSVIRDLPDLSREVISVVSGADLTVRRTYMARFSEGDSQNTPVLFEGCLLENFLVDGIDIKAANSPLIVRRSTFRYADPNNSNADAVDFGPGAATVDGCIIHDFPDKGVSIGGAPGTLVRNSLIYRCGIGVSAYNSSNLVINNTTISSCGSGILFRDNPTRAVGIASNVIVWGNTANVIVTNTSHLNIDYSDIDRTNYPGTGNISLDPLFIAPQQDDYRLSANSLARGAAADGADMGAHFPVGGIPSAPARLAALCRANNEVQLNWADTAENEDGYAIENSRDRVKWQLIGQAAANATIFITQAPAETVYYRVRATNDIGSSFPSNPAQPLMAVPLALQISRLNEAHIVLSFDAVSGKTYTIQSRSILDAGSWTNCIRIPRVVTTGSLNITNESPANGGYFRLLCP